MADSEWVFKRAYPNAYYILVNYQNNTVAEVRWDVLRGAWYFQTYWPDEDTGETHTYNSADDDIYFTEVKPAQTAATTWLDQTAREFREALRQVMRGETQPIETLWDEEDEE